MFLPAVIEESFSQRDYGFSLSVFLRYSNPCPTNTWLYGSDNWTIIVDSLLVHQENEKIVIICLTLFILNL